MEPNGPEAGFSFCYFDYLYTFFSWFIESSVPGWCSALSVFTMEGQYMTNCHHSCLYDSCCSFEKAIDLR